MLQHGCKLPRNCVCGCLDWIGREMAYRAACWTWVWSRSLPIIDSLWAKATAFDAKLNLTPRASETLRKRVLLGISPDYHLHAQGSAQSFCRQRHSLRQLRFPKTH